MVCMKYWSSQCINHCVTSQHVFQILKQAWNYTMMFVHVGPSGFVGLSSMQLLLPCALKILFLCFPERTPGVWVRAWDLPYCWFVLLQTIQSDPPLISSKQDGEAQPNPHNELWQAFALSSFPLSPFLFPSLANAPTLYFFLWTMLNFCRCQYPSRRAKWEMLWSTLYHHIHKNVCLIKKWCPKLIHNKLCGVFNTLSCMARPAFDLRELKFLWQLINLLSLSQH